MGDRGCGACGLLMVVVGIGLAALGMKDGPLAGHEQLQDYALKAGFLLLLVGTVGIHAMVDDKPARHPSGDPWEDNGPDFELD